MTDRDMPENVKAAFAALPDAAKEELISVRNSLFSLAEEIDVGPLTETLKWGDPAYLTEATRAGSTVRLGTTAS